MVFFLKLSGDKVAIMKYLKKEIDKYNLEWQSTLMELNSKNNNREKQFKFDTAIKNYKTANSGFIWAIVFTSIMSLFSLKQGLEEAFACAIFLFGVPHLIAHAHVTNKYDSTIKMKELYPISFIEKKAEFWSLFSIATWSIVMFSVVVYAIFNWGTFEGMEPPF